VKMMNRFWHIEMNPGEPGVALELQSTKARLVMTKKELQELFHMLDSLMSPWEAYGKRQSRYSWYLECD